eukprot:jgi/Bigna1/77906/fgenesh1_pg.51_\
MKSLPPSAGATDAMLRRWIMVGRFLGRNEPVYRLNLHTFDKTMELARQIEQEVLSAAKTPELMAVLDRRFARQLFSHIPAPRRLAELQNPERHGDYDGCEDGNDLHNSQPLTCEQLKKTRQLVLRSILSNSQWLNASSFRSILEGCSPSRNNGTAMVPPHVLSELICDTPILKWPSKLLLSNLTPAPRPRDSVIPASLKIVLFSLGNDIALDHLYGDQAPSSSAKKRSLLPPTHLGIKGLLEAARERLSQLPTTASLPPLLPWASDVDTLSIAVARTTRQKLVDAFKRMLRTTTAGMRAEDTGDGDAEGGGHCQQTTNKTRRHIHSLHNALLQMAGEQDSIAGSGPQRQAMVGQAPSDTTGNDYGDAAFTGRGPCSRRTRESRTTSPPPPLGDVYTVFVTAPKFGVMWNKTTEVKEVKKDTPASKAGVLPRSVLVAIDGIPVKEGEGFKSWIKIWKQARNRLPTPFPISLRYPPPPTISHGAPQNNVEDEKKMINAAQESQLKQKESRQGRFRLLSGLIAFRKSLSPTPNEYCTIFYALVVRCGREAEETMKEETNLTRAAVLETDSLLLHVLWSTCRVEGEDRPLFGLKSDLVAAVVSRSRCLASHYLLHLEKWWGKIEDEASALMRNPSAPLTAGSKFRRRELLSNSARELRTRLEDFFRAHGHSNP